MNIIIKCAMKFNSRVVTLLVLFVRVTFVFDSKIYLLSNCLSLFVDACIQNHWTDRK